MQVNVVNPLKILVVIPYYNKGDKIINCLNSIVLAHNDYPLQEIETIISDDGSSEEVDKSLIEKYSSINLKIVRHENVGCAQARLIGIGASSLSDDAMVFHVDPDDTISMSSFYNLSGWMRLVEADVYIGNLKMFDSGVNIPYYVTPHGDPHPMKLGQVYKTDIRDIMKRGHCVVYKFARLGLWRKCLNRSKLRVNCNEDLFLSTLLYTVAKTVVYTDICHYNYEFGQSTSIMSNTEKNVEPRDSKLTYMLAGMLSEMS